METISKPFGTMVKLLRRKQAKHTVMLRKVEKAVAKVDQRKRKLQALEARIAELERRIADPARRRDGALTAKGEFRHVQLIFNPASGRDDKDNAARLAEIVKSLRAHGIEPRIGLKTSGKAARTLAKDAVREGIGMVVVAAGDGTIGDVASQLVGTHTQLGIIPIGTMNNNARSLGIPLDIDDACTLLAMGTVRHIDIGRMHTNDSAHNEYFLECAGVGLSAIGALAGQAFEKRRWATIPRVLRRFFEAKLGKMVVEIDGVTIEAATRIVTVSNSPLMGNNMLAAPGALMDDGFLDVSLYDGMGDAALISHFMAASSHTPDDTKIYRARRIKITAEERVMGNSDMSIAPARNVIEIEIIPAAVAMIVGNGIALSNPVEAAPPTSTYAPDPPGPNGTAGHETREQLAAKG